VDLVEGGSEVVLLDLQVVAGLQVEPEPVFAFLADPVKAVRAFPMGRKVAISDIVTSPDGGLTSYRETMPMTLGPMHWDVSDTVVVEEYVPNQRIADRSSGGPVHVMSVEASGSGTRLTFTGTVSSQIPLLDKVKVLVFTRGRGQARNMEMVLAEVKKLVEAEAVEAGE